MTNRWVLHAALLLCISTTVLSIDYEQLQFQQSSSIRTCQKLLRQLTGKIKLSYRTNFTNPMETIHPSQMEKRYTVFVMQVMLQNVFLVFRSNFSSTGWNETIVESLLDELYQQTEFLKKILGTKQEERLTWETSRTTRRLRTYYWRVQNYLKGKKYNSYAWMVVRAEIFRNFSIILELTRNFQN